MLAILGAFVSLEATEGAREVLFPSIEGGNVLFCSIEGGRVVLIEAAGEGAIVELEATEGDKVELVSLYAAGAIVGGKVEFEVMEGETVSFPAANGALVAFVSLSSPPLRLRKPTLTTSVALSAVQGKSGPKQ